MSTITIQGRIQGEDRKQFTLDVNQHVKTLGGALDLITTPEEAASWRDEPHVTVSAGSMVRRLSTDMTLGDFEALLREHGVEQEAVVSWQTRVFGGEA